MSLPPEARTHFDQEALSLISTLTKLTPRIKTGPVTGSLGELPIAFHLSEPDIIGRLDVTYRDWLGRFRGFEIHVGDVHEALPPKAATKLERLADSVAGRRDIQPYCGTSYVRKHLMDWIRHRRLGEQADNSWTSELFASLARDVADQTMLVPLEGIQIRVPFELGRVNFDYFTESKIDNLIPSLPPSTPGLKEAREKIKKLYQGRVYTQYRCLAEVGRASDLAFYHADRVLDILRMFESAAFDIRARSLMGRMGQVVPAHTHIFQVSVDGGFRLFREVEHGGTIELNIDEGLLSKIKETGIGIAAELLRKGELTDLEQRALEAISHFAHGVASAAPQDRLVHALVAVESLLLRNESEPIQSRLGQRVALLTAQGLDSRKEVVRDLTGGYKLRSAFVHHGVRPDDVAPANRLLKLCWNALNAVMDSTKRFDSKEALLNRLDDELLMPRNPKDQ